MTTDRQKQANIHNTYKNHKIFRYDYQVVDIVYVYKTGI